MSFTTPATRSGLRAIRSRAVLAQRPVPALRRHYADKEDHGSKPVDTIPKAAMKRRGGPSGMTNTGMVLGGGAMAALVGWALWMMTGTPPSKTARQEARK
ncbi:hypothetical protein PG993_013990 [Apiospora rasikravindrae]|uniref:Uncharacterized protein n=1 Tax=Apiospora rasikravindrae TaxID=990691 RepID=A0ABR1RRS2_9PEZI